MTYESGSNRVSIGAKRLSRWTDLSQIPERVVRRLKNRRQVAGPDYCWEYPSRNARGYGQLAWGRHQGELHVISAHRLAFLLEQGAIGADAMVCHTCDNRACCNPAHLYAGDSFSNMQDRVKRNQASWAKGDASGASKLTEDQVRRIKRALANGRKQREIARSFNVTEATITGIKNGRVWSHVD
jgi:hypothetical protein